MRDECELCGDAPVKIFYVSGYYVCRDCADAAFDMEPPEEE